MSKNTSPGVENLGNIKGKHRQNYVSSFAEGNPEKSKKDDWWDEICKKYGEKNHHKKKRSK